MPLPAIVMAAIGAAASAGAGAATQYGVSYGMNRWRESQQRAYYSSPGYRRRYDNAYRRRYTGYYSQRPRYFTY